MSGPRASRGRRILPALVALVVLAIVIAVAGWLLRRERGASDAPRIRDAPRASDASGLGPDRAGHASAEDPVTAVRTEPLPPEASPAAAPPASGLVLRGTLRMTGPLAEGARAGRMALHPRWLGREFSMLSGVHYDLRDPTPRLGEPVPVAVPGRYEIPVPQRGFYDLAFACDGVFNTAEWGQSTLQAPLQIELRSAASIGIRLDPAADALIASISGIANAYAGGEVRTAVHDEPGRWSIAGPLFLPLMVEIRAVDPGLPVLRKLAVSSRMSLDVSELAVVQVRVTDARSGAGVAGAKVSAQLATHYTGELHSAARTDGEGRARLLVPGSVTLGRTTILAVQAESFLPARRSIFDLDRPVEIALLRRGALGGRLTRADGGPVRGAAVHMPAASGTPLVGRTGDDGRFSLLPGLAFDGYAGTAELPRSCLNLGLCIHVVTADGARGLFEAVDGAAIVAGTWSAAVDPRPCTVRIIRAADGEPVGGATLSLVPRVGIYALRDLKDDGERRTDERGACTFRLFGSRMWTATITPEGREPQVVDVAVVPDGEVTIVLPESRLLRLRIVDTARAPIPKLMVSAEARPNFSLTRQTDAEGLVDFELAAGLRVSISPLSNDLEPGVAAPAAFEADDVVREVVLARRRQLVIWIEPQGAPAPERAFVTVHASGPAMAGFARWQRTPPRIAAGDGSSPPGITVTDESTRCTVYVPGCRPLEVPIPAGAQEVRAEPKPGPMVRGRIAGAGERGLRVALTMTELEGTDLGRLATSAFSTALFTCEAGVGEDGTIEAGPLTPGRYELSVKDASGAVLAMRNVIVRSDVDLGEVLVPH